MAFDLLARLKLDDQMSGRLKKVTRSLGDVETRTKSVSSGFSGLTKTMAGVAGAIGVTALLAKGFNTVTGSIDGAISRFDTLNNFPKILQQVGFSAEDSQKAITRLSDGITGLPTTIDGVAASAQQIAVMTKDIDGAVDTTLALNNAFISSGSDAMDAERGMNQYVKSLSKGKFEMESWTTLQETMGLALNDVAEAFGYTGKSAQNDLYSALKEGHVTFDQFNGKLIELDKAQGGFAERALTASGGIRTAWTNMGTSVVRGVETIIRKIDETLGGVGSIEAIIGKVRGAIDKAFGWVVSMIPVVAGAFKAIYKVIKPFIPYLKAAGLAIGGVAVAALAVIGVIKILAGMFAILTSPVTLIIVGIAALGVAFKKAYEHSEPFRKFVDGVIGAAKGLFSILTGGSFGESFDIMQSMGLNTEQIRAVFDFANKIKGAIDTIKDVFKAVSSGDATGIMQALGFSPETIEKVFGFVETVKTAVSAFIEYLRTKLEEMRPTLETLIGIFTKVKDVAIEIFQTLWNVLGPIFTVIGVALSILGDIAMMVFQYIIVPAINFVITLFQTMWTITGPILELLGAAIQTAFEILKVVWDTILKPVAEWLLGEFKTAFEAATGIVDSIGGAFDTLGGKISGALEWFNNIKDAIKNFKPPEWLSKLGGSISAGAAKVGGVFKSNYHGMDRVPYDGYQARLHRGEKILTRRESDDYERFQFDGSGGASTYNNQTYNNVSTTSTSEGSGGSGSVVISGNEFNVRQESDVKAIAYELAKLIEAERGQMA